MRKVHLLVITMILSAGVCTAQSFDGRTIHLEAGDHISRNVPVSLPWDGPKPAPDTKVIVVELGTGEECPATVRAGSLVFVADGAMPNTQHRYQVKMLPRGDMPHVVRVEKRYWALQIDVFIYDEPFTVYNYSTDYRKPFLWPVCAEGGVTITRSWPMGPEEGMDIKDRSRRRRDHPHQKSLWTSHGNFNGVDTWGERHREDGELEAGYQHTESVTFGSGDAYGWIHARNVWQDGSRNPVVAEEREYRFYATPGRARIFDAVITLTATKADVTFNDTKEGGMLAVRVRDQIRADNQGIITNAEGINTYPEVWGKPAAWCDYSGPIDDAGIRGIAVFDHPQNLRHPTRWHVRDYGLMAANCFGLSDFTKDEQAPLNGDFLLKRGESVTFRYRVYIHSGDVDEARVAERYADYATPPQVSWRE